jgi:DNA-directed RNA polymerase specialized sigma24 family protein
VQPDLLGALRTLPPRLAAAIVLRHYHGYNNREIAASLGVSERTVGTRLRQAGERLRAVLGPELALGAFSLEAPTALSSRKEQETYADS